MSKAALVRLALQLALTASSAALAQRLPQEFKPPAPMTDEEREASKLRARSNLHGYDRNVSVKAEPIPWAAIGLTVLVFAMAAPFGLMLYKRTARELKETSAASSSRERPG